MTNRVVCDKNAAVHHSRQQRLITAAVDFLFRVEKAEGNVFVFRNVFQSVSVNKLDNVADASCLEGLPRDLRLDFGYLECSDLPADDSAGQGKP